jgi:hypothetical protein
MNRRLPFLIALATLAAPAYGDGMEPGGAPAADAPAPNAPAPAPAGGALASDEAAAAALATYREAWKAKGLKGEERLSQRDWALDELSKVQHPSIALELGAVARSGEGDLRLIAVIYLAKQKALAGTAGEQVVLALQKNVKDVAFVLSALQTLGKLGYLGGDDQLKDLLKNEDWAIRKYAITAVGQVADMRLVNDLLAILGVDLKNSPPAAPTEEKKGGKEVVEEGYSWEGAEATVDHGHADNTQENAEAKAKAEKQIAENKAAAAAGKGGGGGGGGIGAGVGGSGGRGGSSRNPDELKPFVLQALKRLTGETFMTKREVHLWFDKNMATVEQKKKDCDVTETTQRAEAKASAKK